jgi:DedD protein
MRNGEPGWFASLLGAGVLIAGGFALGLVAGVVSEEPELVVGHLVGRSDEVAWAPEGEPEFTAAAGQFEPIDALEASETAELADLDLPTGQAAARAEDPETAWIDDGPAPELDLPAVAAAPPRRRAAPLRDVSGLPVTGGAEKEPAFDEPADFAPTSGFAVQVGAFSEGSAAEDVRQKLHSKGFESYVIPASQSGDGKWRVRVGPVPTRGAADSLAGRLKSEERLPTWVLSEGGG